MTLPGGMTFLTWEALHQRGILPSRQHTARLVKRAVLPRPYRLGDPVRGRLVWSEADITQLLAEREAARALPVPPAIPHSRSRVSSPATKIVEPGSTSLTGGAARHRLILDRPQR